MFSNLKKKVSQRRHPSPQPPANANANNKNVKEHDDATEKASTVAASSEFSSERTTATTATSTTATAATTTMKIHIQIKFRPAWNSNDKILSCLQKQHVDVLLHKSAPSIDKEWHQIDLFGKLELPNSDTMTQAQHMEALKRELQVAMGQPEAIVSLKHWEPRRRRQKMQSTPVGVGRGSNAVGLFGEPLGSNSRPPLSSSQQQSRQSRTTQSWKPAKIVLQDESGNPIEYNIRLSPQSIRDLQADGVGNSNNELRDYHGMAVKKDGNPICLLTAQVLQQNNDGNDGNVQDINTIHTPSGTDLSHVDQHHRRLQGHVRKPSM